MRVNLAWDDSVLRDKIGVLSAKGLAYAAVNALNNTAKLVQKTEREELHRNFEIRTPTTTKFLERQVAIIKPFASVNQGRAYTEISVGQRPKLLLSTFEAGGIKSPVVGTRGVVAVPVTGQAARPSFSRPVPKTLFLRALKIKGKKTKSGKVQYKGAQRTFLLKHTAKAPLGGVFQRIGPERDDVRMIYSFKSKPRLKSSLHFVKTAERIAFVWMKREFADQLAREIQRAERREA